MTKSRSVEKTQDILPDKIRMPTESYRRTNFYKTTENVRYFLKFNLTNGQQAEDIPIGIEDLIEFLGDVEMLIEDTDNIDIRFKNYGAWYTKLQCEETYLNDINWVQLESVIESLAEKHGIALKKSMSMSGRGYIREGYRCVVIHYSFGTYSPDEPKRIKNEYTPLSNIEWVGGKIGQKENLNESTFKIKSVRKIGYLESLYQKICSHF